MKFILDMPVSQRTAEWLRSQGHDAIHVRDIGFSRAQDEVILKHAIKENRIIVTMDLDFPRLISVLSLDSPGVILIRIAHPRPQIVNERFKELFKVTTPESLPHSICVIEEAHIRIHKLPIK